MTRVEPDGPVPCDLAIVGEAPSHEELKQGRGFVGPSGRLLWGEDYNLIGGIIGRPRETVYVTNVCKVQLPEPEWEKMTYKEREPYINELIAEMKTVHPKVVLAFGRRACSALYPRFKGIKLDQGNPRWGGSGYIVMPMWHPAAFLRGNSEAIGDMMIACAKVPDLLANGMPLDNYYDQPTEEYPATLEEMLQTWPASVGFLTPKKISAGKCKLCGRQADVQSYEGRSLKWKLCVVCAVGAEDWAIQCGDALYEHDEQEAGAKRLAALERAANRLEKSYRKALHLKEGE